MSYVKITNGEVESYNYSIGHLRRDNPNKSFPKKMTNEILATYGLEAIFPKAQPEFEPLTQYLRENALFKEDGTWWRTWSVINKDIDEASQNVRAKRDELIKETIDTMNPMRWEVLSDEEKEKWRTYRRELLDVSVQADFPYTVNWPTLGE